MATTIQTLAIWAQRKKIWQHFPTVASPLMVDLDAPKCLTTAAKENVNSSENTNMMSKVRREWEGEG